MQFESKLQPRHFSGEVVICQVEVMPASREPVSRHAVTRDLNRYRVNECKPPPKFASCFFGVLLSCTVASQVSQLVSHPMTQPLFADVIVFIDEHDSAGQVGEHQTLIACGDVDVKDASGLQVLRVCHKGNSRPPIVGHHVGFSGC